MKDNEVFNIMTFPCGEQNIHHIAFTNEKYLSNELDITRLALKKDILNRKFPHLTFSLLLPYVPYGRQDRVTSINESFSLKVYATLLNSLRFNQVVIVDPHSDVTSALIENVKVILALDVIRGFTNLKDRYLGEDKETFLISPDAGSNKKVNAIGQYFQNPVVRADKTRNIANGNLSGCIVYHDDFKGADVLIIDDICDGGGTFIMLAKELKAKNCGKVILYVTHGAFTKGTGVLFDGGIDEIYTTDSFDQTNKNTNYVELSEIYKRERIVL